MSDSDNDSVHTPTQSEFATFEVLANREYTNMGKRKPRGRDLKKVPVQVIEESESDSESSEPVARRGQSSTVANKMKDKEKDKNKWEKEKGKEKDNDLDDDANDEEEQEDELEEKASKSDENENEEEESEKEDNQDDDFVLSPPSNPSNHISSSNLTEAPSYHAFRPVSPSANNFSQTNYSSMKQEKQDDTDGEKRKAYMDSVEAERRDEKEGILNELILLQEAGQCKLVKTFTMADSLEEISFQYDRCQSEIEAKKMVNLVKSSIDMGAGVIEMLAKNMGFQLLDGYHKSLCSDMTRFDRPLSKLYKKYWRRGSQKPEMELAMIVLGSFGWTIMSNMIKDGSYLKRFFGGASKKSSANDTDKTESLKSKFAQSANSSASPAASSSSASFDSSKEDRTSEGSNSKTTKFMKPPVSSMNVASPWTKISSIGSDSSTSPQDPLIGSEREKRLQQKEEEIEKKLERLSLLEQRLEKLSQTTQTNQTSSGTTGPISANGNGYGQTRVQSLSDSLLKEKDKDENNSITQFVSPVDAQSVHSFSAQNEEDAAEPWDSNDNAKRVVLMTTPPPSGRRSAKKTVLKQPMLKL